MKKKDYDIVIIGSGAGGGTVAKALSPLCAQGYRIALLEWGGVFTDKDNTRDELAMAKKYYFARGGFQTRSQDMTLAFAKALGGSTTVYTGTSIIPKPAFIHRWNIEGLDFQDLKPRYEKYVLENNVHYHSEEEINDNNRLFFKGAKKLGLNVEPFPVNTKNCRGLGTCNLGCAVLAKQGTAVVQIPVARQNGVDVVPFCRVDHIDDHDVVAHIIPSEHGLASSPWPVGCYRIRAKKIVLCAGAIYSPVLLLRSLKRRPLPALGRYFTCHPALILAAEHPHGISNVQGHPKTYYCDEFADSHHFLLETCMYFPFTLAKSLSGFGREMDELMGAYPRLQMILALVIDRAAPHNRVTLDHFGNPMVDYRFSEESLHAFVQAMKVSTNIFFAAGAKRVHAPAMKSFFIRDDEKHKINELISEKYFKLGKVSISAAHLMGGCRMGESSKDSVTNSWGQVHGYPHLYVADASLFPDALGVNPYLTIMALADRVAEGIRREDPSSCHFL